MVKTISTIEEFLEFTEKPVSDYPYIYRGQSNYNWPLVPSLYRVKSRIESTDGKWNSIESQILDSFKKQAFPILREKPSSYLDWLTLAQHPGLPTRLLDWSSNPLVALFFAVENLSSTEATVFKIYPTLGGVMDKINDGTFKPKDTIVIYPYHVSNRTSVQQGCFTLHPFPEGQNDYDPNSMFMKASSIRIKPESKFQLKRELDKFGINYFTMFPGLDGLTKKMKWEIERDYRFSD